MVTVVKGCNFTHTHPQTAPTQALVQIGLSECRSTPADATTGPSRHSNNPPKLGHARSAHLALIRSTGSSRCTLRATQIRRMTIHCPEIGGPQNIPGTMVMAPTSTNTNAHTKRKSTSSPTAGRSQRSRRQEPARRATGKEAQVTRAPPWLMEFKKVLY